MSGGYRVLFAGALAALLFTAFGFGWLSGHVLNNPSEERYQSYRYAADQPLQINPAAPGRASAQPFEYRSPCDNPKGHDESDLCAQWKAANAAQDGAFWTKWGFWVGVVGSALLLWQISLTREAVEDTSEATLAMKRQNEIAELDQRAWVRLEAVPKLVRRYGVDGLYMRIDFVAENVGRSAATHFEMFHEVLFQGQAEDSRDFDARIKSQIQDWKSDYNAGPKSNLVPNDIQVTGIWDDYDASTIGWWDMGIGETTAHPALVCAVLYRTTSAPDLVQFSWRSWYLVSVTDDGQLVSFIPFPRKQMGPDSLRTETFLASMAHEEYESKYEGSRPTRGKTKTVLIKPVEEGGEKGA
jgi:hypothetical protein